MCNAFHAVKIHHGTTAFDGMEITKQLMNICPVLCIGVSQNQFQIIQLFGDFGEECLPQVILGMVNHWMLLCQDEGRECLIRSGIAVKGN